MLCSDLNLALYTDRGAFRADDSAQRKRLTPILKRCFNALLLSRMVDQVAKSGILTIDVGQMTVLGWI